MKVGIPAGETPLFSRKNLMRLIIPLVIEQVLALTIGLADTVMVTSVGECAVSGVSLVDSISFLVISILTALTTGGAVVSAQYLGSRDPANACSSAKQLFYAVISVAGLMALVALCFRGPILHLVFGQLDPEIEKAAMTYFLLTALSYPFLGIYNAGAALFRSMGNSKVSMFTSLIMNLINVGLNAALIFGAGIGVLGAGIATLTSRVVGGLIITALACRPDHSIHVIEPFHFELDVSIIKRILSVGIPTGMENGMFQIGKLMVLGLVTPLGVAATAANAISNSVASIVNMPGMAISLSIITVVGQCMGAGSPGQATYYVRKLMVLVYGLMIGLSTVVGLFRWPILSLFGLSHEATAMAAQVIFWFCVMGGIFWPPSFAIPNVLRAAGDGKFTMYVSMFSMWIFRVGGSYFLVLILEMGLLGVWVSMFIDWVVRSAFFGARYMSGRWKTKKVI